MENIFVFLLYSFYIQFQLLFDLPLVFATDSLKLLLKCLTAWKGSLQRYTFFFKQKQPLAEATRLHLQKHGD